MTRRCPTCGGDIGQCPHSRATRIDDWLDTAGREALTRILSGKYHTSLRRTDFEKADFILGSLRLMGFSVYPINTARRVAAEQANDDGLWFKAETAPEAYLQQALRRLHAVIEGDQ